MFTICRTTKQCGDFGCQHEVIIAVNLRKPRPSTRLLHDSLAFLQGNPIGLIVIEELIDNSATQIFWHIYRFRHNNLVGNTAPFPGRCTAKWHKENSDEITKITNNAPRAWSTRIAPKNQKPKVETDKLIGPEFNDKSRIWKRRA